MARRITSLALAVYIIGIITAIVTIFHITNSIVLFTLCSAGFIGWIVIGAALANGKGE